VWEQHPNPNRFQRQVFETYFKGAMASKGAFIIKSSATGDVIGCTRFYDYNEAESQVLIGYTFFGRAFWGKGFNPAAKKLMLDYAFQFVDKVIFHVGVNNTRSRIAMDRLGAINAGLEEVAYFGEPPKMNVVYVISRPT
jgi:RimJ/RimL family protein N-acetyltransferase